MKDKIMDILIRMNRIAGKMLLMSTKEIKNVEDTLRGGRLCVGYYIDIEDGKNYR